MVGAGIFAGNVYRCYTTRFPTDTLVDCASLEPHNRSVAGCFSVNPLQAPCEPEVAACPSGMGLGVSKCQGCDGYPSNIPGVSVSLLLGLAARRAAEGRIDPLEGVARGRYWLYRGAKDACYNVGSVDHAAELYSRLGGAVDFVNSTVASLHAIPTVADGTPCGTEGNYTEAAPHGLEACGFDGAGAALQHIYSGSLRPPVPQVARCT